MRSHHNGHQRIALPRRAPDRTIEAAHSDSISPQQQSTAGTMSLVVHFLVQIRQFVRASDGASLRDWLRVEPNSSGQYHRLAEELRAKYHQKKKLDDEIEDGLPEDDDPAEGQATMWQGFIAFMKDYFLFWRDVNYDDLLGAHQLLSGLLK